MTSRTETSNEQESLTVQALPDRALRNVVAAGAGVAFALVGRALIVVSIEEGSHDLWLIAFGVVFCLAGVLMAGGAAWHLVKPRSPLIVELTPASVRWWRVGEAPTSVELTLIREAELDLSSSTGRVIYFHLEDGTVLTIRDLLPLSGYRAIGAFLTHHLPNGTVTGSG